MAHDGSNTGRTHGVIPLTSDSRPLTAEELELIAGLLDGTLDRQDRIRAVELLERSDAAYDAYTEARGVADPPHAGARRAWTLRAGSRFWPLPAITAAAVLAGIVIGPWTPGRGTAGRPELSVPRISGEGRLQGIAELGESAWMPPFWPRTRGLVDSMRREQIEFWIGVRWVGFEVAAAVDRQNEVQENGSALLSLLNRLDDSGPIIVLVERLLDPAGGSIRPADSEAQREQVLDAIGLLLGDAPPFHLGIWTEKSRVALSVGNLEFFDDATRRELDGIRDALGDADQLESVALLLDRVEGRLSTSQRRELLSQTEALFAEYGS